MENPSSDTLFYDKHRDGDLNEWLNANPPSTTLKSDFRWLEVVRPSLDLSDYEYSRNRLGQTRPEVVEAIRPVVHELSHTYLLDKALKEKVYKGYWMIFCDHKDDLDAYWKCLVRDFCAQEDELFFTQLACCRYDDGKPGGMIYIINADFTDIKTIGELAQMIKRVVDRYNLDDFKVFYYKPAFYTDVGRSGKDASIFGFNTKFGTSFKYSHEDVFEWFENVPDD